MKRIIISLLSIAAASMMQAAEVSRQEAQATAKAFMAQMMAADNSRQTAMGKSISAVDNAVTLNSVETGVKEVHAFNMADGRGFVIVSGSDRTEAVLGYSTEGNIDANMPPAMKALLRSYAAQVTEAEQGDGEAQQQTPEVYTVKQPVAPLIKTKWNQDTPYNNMLDSYTDENNELKHYPTGCVATAMAMVVNYYRWPEQTAPIPATKNTSDLPATSFDWSAMTDTYSDESSKEACDAVAKLMKYCGGACRMKYGVGQSMANSYDMAFGMVRYFGYDANTINVVRRTMVTEREWQDLIYRELAEQRPVCCGGDGHQILIDGYSQGDYFHINWGWGGNKDGFFKLSATNQYVTKTQILPHFPYDAVTGMIPTTVPYVAEPQTLKTDGIILTADTPLQMQRTGDTDFPYIRALLAMANVCEGYNDYSFDFGMGLYSGDQLLKVFVAGEDIFVEAEKYFHNVEVTMDFGKGLADGQYRLMPISRLHGTEQWNINEDVAPTYINAVIKGNTLTLDVYPGDHHLKINSITFSGPLTEGSEVTAVVNITNGSNRDFDGILALINDVDGNVDNAGTLKERFYPIAAGETADVEFKFTAGVQGTYNARILYEAFMLGDGVPFVITSGTNASDAILLEKIVSVDNATLREEDGYVVLDVIGRVMDATVTLKNTDTEATYKGEVSAIKYSKSPIPQAPLVKGATLPAQQVTIGPGQSVDVHIHYDKLDMTEEQYFDFVASYNGSLDNDTKGKMLCITTVQGINVYSSDGSVKSYDPATSFNVPADAAAVEMISCGVTKLTPSKNPNCLYYFYESDIVPEALQGLNVVKITPTGPVADNITIHDGYDFITPSYFDAKNVTYTRSFTEAEHEGYSTLMLPFDAQSCDAGDETFTLQMQEFYGDQPGKLFVREANELPKCGKPYLVRVQADKVLTTPVTFRATNALVGDSISAPSAGTYYLNGTFCKTLLQGNGNFAFADGQGGTTIPTANSCSPFRAYFTSINFLPTGYDCLVIDDQTFQTTSISVVQASSNGTSQSGDIHNSQNTVHGEAGASYTLDGRKINSQWPNGIIIQNGKKYYTHQ